MKIFNEKNLNKLLLNYDKKVDKLIEKYKDVEPGEFYVYNSAIKMRLIKYFIEMNGVLLDFAVRLNKLEVRD